MNPGRNTPARVPYLKEFVDSYLKARASELQPGTIELAKDLVKYALIAAAMLFVIFRVIKPAFSTLFTPGAFVASTGEHSAASEQTEVSYSSSAPPYEQGLQTARQIAQQEPKIVAGVIKEWVNSNG